MIQLILILISFLSLNSYAQFVPHAHESDEVGVLNHYIEFNDLDLAHRFFKKEISEKQFIKKSLENLDRNLKEVFNCISLTNEEVVTECLSGNDIPFYTFKVPTFSYTIIERNAGWEWLYDHFGQALKEKLESLSIHEKLREKIRIDYINSVELSLNSFYSQEQEEKLRSIFKMIRGESKTAECTIIMTENAMNLSETNYTPGPQFDKEKCQHSIDQMYYELDGFTWNYDGEEFTYNLIRQVHPRLAKVFHEVFSKEIVDQTYSEMITIYYEKGKEYDAKKAVAVEALGVLLRKIFEKNYTLASIFEFLEKTEPDNYVEYEGVLGIHKYGNNEYRSQIVALTDILYNTKTKFRNFVIENKLSEKFVDTNDTTERSRLEPIDLLSNLIYRKIKDQAASVAPNIKSYLKAVIQKIAGLTESIEHPVYVVPKEKSSTGPNLYCAEDYFSSDFKEMTENFLERVWFELDPARDDISRFKCAGKSYELDHTVMNEAPLQLPKDSKINDGYVDIIMPYSLTEELNDNFKKLAIMYFKGLRYKLETTEIADVEKFVLQEIPKTDLLMPAGHSLASRNLDIGTIEGELLTFTRKKRRKDKYGIRFKIILPKKGTRSASLDLQQLSDAYLTRIKEEANSLFVFVISCNSEYNLFDWSQIYRSSLNRYGSDPAKIPYVIASKRGFPTNSNIDIAGSIFYPSDVADFMAQGKSAEEIYEILLTKKYGSIAKELTKRVGAAWLIQKGLVDWIKDLFAKPENETFEPAYNLSDEYREDVLRRNGIRYQLFEEGTLIYEDIF